MSSLTSFFSLNSYTYQPISQTESQSDIELGPSTLPKEYPGTVEISADSVLSSEKAKFKEPPTPPGTAAGDASLFLGRQDFLLNKQYMSEEGTISTIGNVIHKILSKAEEKTLSSLDLKTAQDLGLIGSGKTIASQMDKTKTKLGSTLHYLMITRPHADLDRAKNRQNLIKLLIADIDLQSEMNDLLTELQEGEIALFSCWDGKSQLPGSANSLYFSVNPRVNAIANNSSLILDISALWTTTKKMIGIGVTAVSVAVFPIFAATEAYRSFTGIKSPEELQDYANRYVPTSLGSLGAVVMTPNNSIMNATAAAVAACTCLMSLPSSVAWLKADTAMLPLMRGILSRIATYYRSMKQIHQILSQRPDITEKLEHFSKLDNFIKNKNEIKEIDIIFSVLDSFSFNKDNEYFFRPGEVLLTWELLHSGGAKKNKNKTAASEQSMLPGDIIRGAFEEALPAIAEIDVLISSVTLMQESRGQSATYCFPDLSDTAADPFLHMEGAWNPMISRETVVPNDVSLGEGAPAKGAIITGPNTRGKSSFGKTIALIAALTPYGIVPAKKVETVVFNSIRTSMNIIDNIEEGDSFFVAQSKLIAMIVNNIDKLPEGVHSLTIVDESFVQTNKNYAEALLIGTLKKLSTLQGNITVAITHFPEVAITLGDKEDEQYKNYKMETTSRYQLVEGVSTEEDSNAIETAAECGVHPDIIQAAKEANKAIY